MLLLLTSSGDGTSDRIVARMRDSVFRYNFDQASQFSTLITPTYWEIENPVGRKISSETARRVLWWKAFVDRPDEVDPYIYSEQKYICHELYSRFTEDGSRKGNPTTFHHLFGKLRILGIAQKYFIVPPSAFTWNRQCDEVVSQSSRIVKSLSSALMADGRSLFTTDVSNRGLDPAFPWFCQSKVDATHDVTVFMVGENLFGFTRDRSALKGLDWRSEQNFYGDVEEWFPFQLREQDIKALLTLASELSVDWGRFDLMLDQNGNLVFLEFNANGQWVFLDYHDKHGLLDAVVTYLND